MNYSNGFDTDLVVPALRGRIGWRQPTISGSPVIDPDNSTAKSGRYFGNSFHALCTIANLKANQEDPSINDGDFNVWLSGLQNDMILRSLNEVFREPELIEQTLLYTRFGFNDIPIVNSKQFVGYAINIANDQGIATQINYLTLYFTQTGTFPIYLYEDGVKDPIHSFNVNVSAWQHTQWELDGSDGDHPQIILKFVRGRRYYIGYYQTDLGTNQAIREQIDVWESTKCFEAYPLSAPVDSFFGFNHNYRQFPFLPGGVNLEMISFKDHTERIIRKANLFDELQGLQMAAFALELVNNSTRTNLTQRNTEQQSQQQFMELNQAFSTKEVPVTPGLKSRIDREFNRIRNTFFPKGKPISLPMQSTGIYDQLDAQWNKAVKRQLTNPSWQVIPSGGGDA